ncbi:hypothetical protein NEMBOFW57_010579 [Staphylotrichum longicolle]|uniref:Glycosyl transferase CAP10 domain-containing protein n=1 Tax=Staphylotrichum longicolle TaxID=669026 RepID=A0AAD4ENC3_9PEZI|nr:hypothetical protein NEMBOFW57_010579 [Staphylotrichum longicolle]
MVFPRRPSTLLRYLVPALLITLTFYLLTEHGSLTPRFGPLVFSTAWGRKHRPGAHPIDALIKGADKKFADKIARSTHTLPDAAAAYRKRRGRHPPPGFDKWHEFAQEKNAIIVEDFWDQIYHDLEPFWGVPPAQIRKNAREFEMRIEVRDHKASSGSDWFWTKIWLEMIQKVEHILPDMDLALNAMDEPRMVVPWEDIEGYMKKADEARKIVNVKNVVSEFAKLPPLGEAPTEHVDSPPVEWEHHKHYWLIARRGCAPDSPARQADILTNFDRPPTIASPFTLLHMQEGYVANYSLSTDFCHQPTSRASKATLGDWLAPRVNISFTDLMCSHEGFFPGCNYTNAFSALPALPMAEQFRHNTCRTSTATRSAGATWGSCGPAVPVKASLWREWHDARLVAWKHFVPMDSRAGDARLRDVIDVFNYLSIEDFRAAKKRAYRERDKRQMREWELEEQREETRML